MTNVTVELTEGSDLSVVSYFKDATGAAIPLTNHTVEIYDAVDMPLGSLTVAITDAAEGEYTVTFTWPDAEPIRNGKRVKFRTRITDLGTGLRTASGVITIWVK